MSVNGKCIVVGAGHFDMDKLPVEAEDFVIAADGGYDYCQKIGVIPDLILGDFDSMDLAAKLEIMQRKDREPEKILTLPTEKDDTDTLAALREGLKRGYRDFEIYGSQGGRLSHTMANMQCLMFLKENGADGCLIEKNSRVFLIREETTVLPESWKGYCSLFSFGEKAEGVSIRNMKYELENAKLCNSFPIGVSNEFVGREAVIIVQKGTLLAICEFQP